MNDEAAITKWCSKNYSDSDRYLHIILDLCQKNRINWSRITEEDRAFVAETAQWVYENKSR